MGREPDAVVVPAKTAVDRTIVHRGNGQLYASLLPTLDRIHELVVEVEALRSRSRLSPVKIRLALASIDQEYRMLKETVLDRTLPVLSRETVAYVMGMLPQPSGVAAAVVDQVSDAEKARGESIALLRAVIAKLSVGSTPGERPGLVLIRREAS